MTRYPLNIKPPLSFPTVSGSVCTFNSQYAGLPLKSHKVAVNAIQSGSGTPSPDNVRTINGYSAINIIGTGKNFAPINARTATAAGTTITVDADGVATVSNTGTASHFFEYYRANFNFPKGTFRFTAWINGEEYTQSGIVTAPYRIYLYMTNGGQVNAGNSFTVNQDTGLWTIYIQTRNGYTYNNDEVKIQIELGTVATEWQKFGKLVTINLGGTYYGGTYDARTGVLTITHLGVDMGTLTWEKYTGIQSPYIIFYTTLTGRKEDTNILIENCEFMGNYYSASFAYNELTHDYSFAGGSQASNSFRGYVRVDSATTASDVISALSGHYLVYELTTPQTIQLEPCPIDILQGVNNVWADTGPTELQFPKFG